MAGTYGGMKYDGINRSRIIIYLLYVNSICNTFMVINEME